MPGIEFMFELTWTMPPCKDLPVGMLWQATPSTQTEQRRIGELLHKVVASQVAAEQESELILKLLGVLKEKVSLFCHFHYSVF